MFRCVLVLVLLERIVFGFNYVSFAQKEYVVEQHVFIKHCQLRMSKLSQRDARIFIWGISRQKQKKMAAPRGMAAIDINTITRDK